jgi:hypothetical protein
VIKGSVTLLFSGGLSRGVTGHDKTRIRDVQQLELGGVTSGVKMPVIVDRYAAGEWMSSIRRTSILRVQTVYLGWERVFPTTPVLGDSAGFLGLSARFPSASRPA